MKKQSKYQEVVSYLKNGIESGRFPTGSRLPSIRQLSLDFHCSKDTIQRALLELRHEQYLYAKPQSGYYVLEQGQHQDLEIEVTDEHASAYDDFRLCINETLIGRENYLFNYYDNQEGFDINDALLCIQIVESLALFRVQIPQIVVLYDIDSILGS